MELEEEYNDEIEAGIIIEQDKQEGEEVLAGSKIKVKASLGIEQVEVPDLSGKSEEQAKAAIAEAKLKWVRTDKVKDSSKGIGVVGQSISAKSMVNKNSEITITINEFQEIKHGVLNINVAALTGYTAKYEKVQKGLDDEGNPKYEEVLVTPNKVHLVVTVDGEQVESKDVSQDLENFSVGFDSTGTVTVKVIIDGSTKATKSMNLDTTTTINIP